MATFPNRMFSSFSTRLTSVFGGNPRPRATPPSQRPGQPSPRIANQDVVVDGNRYEATVFVDCTLVYKGGELPVFVKCTFRQVKLRLEGEAFNTAQYLQSLYAIGLSPAAEKVAAGIQQDTLPLTEYPVPPPAVNLGTNYGQLALYSTIVVIIGSLLGAALWYGFLYYPVNVVLASEPARPLSKPDVYDTMPALPAELADRYDQWKADQLKLLGSYGWVDKPQGVAHIPIDEAINLLAEQGLPVQAIKGK